MHWLGPHLLLHLPSFQLTTLAAMYTHRPRRQRDFRRFYRLPQRSSFVTRLCPPAFVELTLTLTVPDLGRNTPEVLRLHDALHTARSHLKTTRASSSGRDGSGGDSLLSASQGLVRATDDYNHAKGLATSRISSRAVAMGYAAGISALVLLLVPIKLMGPSTWSLRCAIAGSGLCWGLGTIRELQLFTGTCRVAEILSSQRRQSGSDRRRTPTSSSRPRTSRVSVQA